MAYIPKPVKDVDTGELRNLIAEVIRSVLGPDISTISKQLERIAQALEKKSK